MRFCRQDTIDAVAQAGPHLCVFGDQNWALFSRMENENARAAFAHADGARVLRSVVLTVPPAPGKEAASPSSVVRDISEGRFVDAMSLVSYVSGIVRCIFCVRCGHGFA